MKKLERKISYSPQMILARQTGRKTQTRRVVACTTGWVSGWEGYTYTGACPTHPHQHLMQCGGAVERISCPYGQPGDRLWVQENHRIWITDDAKREVLVGYEADGTVERRVLTEDEWEKLKTRKNRVPTLRFSSDSPALDDATWQRTRLIPGRFMFRSLSRGLDEIVSVRIERLQDISEEDAVAEGCDGNCPVGYIPAHQASPCVYQYAQLWESINGPGSWDKNPYVWAVTFRPALILG